MADKEASTTKSETGWSKEWPHKAGAGDEYYFVRRTDRGDVVVMGFGMGKAWLNGVAYEPSEMRSHLFLGPLTPTDAEQLERLREAAEKAAAWIEAQTWACQHSDQPLRCSRCASRQKAKELSTALRHALGTQD